MGGGGQFGSLREAYIPNHSLLLCLEALEKFLVVGGVGWWSRPVLGFSLSQAEQYLDEHIDEHKDEHRMNIKMNI